MLSILLGIVFLYFLAILLIYLFQDRIVFQPSKLNDNYVFQFEDNFEELWIETEDKLKLNALYFRTSEPKGVILYFHGNRGNLQRWAQYYSDFNPRGYDFFAIDYRGYGKSEGEPSETGLYKDASAAYQWLLKQYTSDQIIIYGRSLGTGVACELASRTSSKLVILETPFNSIKGAIRHAWPFLWNPLEPRNQFPNDQRLAKISEPIFIIQGTRDRVVPYSSAIKLKPSLKPGDQFFVIEGGRHKNLNTFPEYYQYLDTIFGTK